MSCVHSSAYRGQDGRHYCRSCGQPLTLSVERLRALDDLHASTKAFLAVSRMRAPMQYSLALRDLRRALEAVDALEAQKPDLGQNPAE